MAAPAPSGDAPLPATDGAGPPAASEAGAPAARPPAPSFSITTTILMFLFFLGLLMLVFQSWRNEVAMDFGYVLAPLIGFGGRYVLLTMFLAAVIEMVLTALAYNWATDWFKAAKVQQWGAAFRKVQMAALRSGKKDRVDALKPAQARFTQISSEVSIAQLKGMAVTWFLVIAIYTWIGLYLGQLCGQTGTHTCANAAAVTVNLFGAAVNIFNPAGWLVPPWFLLFSLYTVPMSLLFRRLLKHYSLREHEARGAAAPGTTGPEVAGGVS